MSCPTCRGGKGHSVRQPVRSIVPGKPGPTIRHPVPPPAPMGNYAASQTRIRDRIMGVRYEPGK
jgi:hypothetical protein